jgi:hypothetical protein
MEALVIDFEQALLTRLAKKLEALQQQMEAAFFAGRESLVERIDLEIVATATRIKSLVTA